MPICGCIVSLVAQVWSLWLYYIGGQPLKSEKQKEREQFHFLFNFMHVNNTSSNGVVPYVGVRYIVASWAGFLCCFLPTVFIWYDMIYIKTDFPGFTSRSSGDHTTTTTQTFHEKCEKLKKLILNLYELKLYIWKEASVAFKWTSNSN